MDLTSFQDRINYKGDLRNTLELVAKDYDLGRYKAHRPIIQGYEDFNIVLETKKGQYLVKIMASSRSDHECEQYANIMRVALNSGISHPKLYSGSSGDLFKINLDNIELWLVVMDFIDGMDFYTLHEKPSIEEIVFLSQQAAKINQLNLFPKAVYDSWAIPNFLKEYNQVKDDLDKDDLVFIKPLAEKFNKLNLDKLPRCFVHGDIICTNVMKSKGGKLFIIDFAVSNIYPRIQELAILLCDLFFDINKSKYLFNYNLALAEYQKSIKLEKEEVEILPTYIKLAHAMHVIPATREKLKKTQVSENNFWLKSGQEGIRIASEIWE